MGLGSTIARAIISGAIQAAKDVASQEANSNRVNQPAKKTDEATSWAERSLAAPSMEISLRKALRVLGIVDGLLEQTRDEWLAGFRAAFDEDPQVQQILTISRLHAHLKNKGFPCDTDEIFWNAVSDIEFELMLHKAFPEAWEDWNEDLDNILEHAADEAKRIAGEHRMETVAKLMPDGRFPTDATVLSERLTHAMRELLAQVILPGLTGAGMVMPPTPVFAARLANLITKTVLSDMIELGSELVKSADGK